MAHPEAISAPISVQDATQPSAAVLSFEAMGTVRQDSGKFLNRHGVHTLCKPCQPAADSILVLANANLAALHRLGAILAAVAFKSVLSLAEEPSHGSALPCFCRRPISPVVSARLTPQPSGTFATGKHINAGSTAALIEAVLLPAHLSPVAAPLTLSSLAGSLQASTH